MTVKPKGAAGAAAAPALSKDKLRLLEQWESVPYDGIRGLLPDWIPEYFSNRFYIQRFIVMERVAEGRTTFERALELLRIYSDQRAAIEYLMSNSGQPGDPSHETIELLATVQKAVAAGDSEGLKMLGGADAVRGRKVIRGSTKGHEAAYGTQQDKQEDRDRYQQTVNELRAEHPKWTWQKLSSQAAEKVGVSQTTIKRYCLDPRKKS